MALSIDVHVYLHQVPDPEVIFRLDAMNVKLDAVLKGEQILTQELTDLQADVAAEVTVGEGIVTLVTGLAAKIDAMKNDPAALAALSASLKASTAAISAAITANTPSA